MTGLIIGGCIFLIIIVLLVLVFFNIHDNNSRLETVNNAIEKEIKDFLFIKNDINYVFKNNNWYQQMKDEIKTAIIDLRYNKYTLNKSYISRSENKIKQIARIINKYYQLDKKIIIDIDNEEVNNNILIEDNENEINNE